MPPGLTSQQRRRAILRIALGWMQMFGAALSFLMLLSEGTTARTIAATIATLCLVGLSRLLVHGGHQ
jgi:hypothetical protein